MLSVLIKFARCDCSDHHVVKNGVFWGIFWLKKLRNQRFYSFLILLVSIFIISVFNILSFVSTDESFITKVSIFLSIEKFFNFPIFDILFGYGLLNGGFVISYEEGKYAHALS